MATKKTTKSDEVVPVKKERPMRGRGGAQNFPSMIAETKSEN